MTTSYDHRTDQDLILRGRAKYGTQVALAAHLGMSDHRLSNVAQKKGGFSRSSRNKLIALLKNQKVDAEPLPPGAPTGTGSSGLAWLWLRSSELRRLDKLSKA